MRYFKVIFCYAMSLVVFSNCSKDDTENFDISGKDIIRFRIEEANYSAELDQENAIINIKVAANIDLTSVSPKITISEGASIVPNSLELVDFTKELSYEVTAMDGSKKVYTINAQQFTDIAFLIVDMQNGAFNNPQFPIFNSDEIIENVRELKTRFANANKHVFYCMNTTPAIPEGSNDWMAVSGLSPSDEDIVVLKTTPNAFEGSDLVKELNNYEIGEVIICGVATELCINSTFNGANGRGYKIIMMADGHSTLDNGAEQIINRYNSLWKSKGANVLNGSQVEL